MFFRCTPLLFRFVEVLQSVCLFRFVVVVIVVVVIVIVVIWSLHADRTSSGAAPWLTLLLLTVAERLPTLVLVVAVVVAAGIVDCRLDIPNCGHR